MVFRYNKGMENKRKTIYYEFWKLENGQEGHLAGEVLQGTGTRTIGSNTITTGIDMIPTATLSIPLADLPTDLVANGVQPNLALYIIKIYYQFKGKIKYKFIGTIDTMNIDYANAKVELNLSHRVARMREWVMPTGYVVKDADLDYVIGSQGADLGFSSTMGSDTQTYEARVNFTYRDGVDKTKLEISFSSTNKLEALQEVMNNTEDVHFAVDLSDAEGDNIIIGRFGEDSRVIVVQNPVYEDECTNRDTSRWISMLTEPTFVVDYTSHFNRAVVFCGDIAEGVMHMTLKEVFENEAVQREAGTYIDSEGKEKIAFPVGMYNKEINLQPETEWKQDDKETERIYNTTKINNDKIYENLEIVAYANNDNREYYVTDAEQLDEDEVIKHTVYNFTDLYPIPEIAKTEEVNGESKTIEYAITDDDRREIAKRAYLRAIRILKAQRPEHVWQFNSTPLPTNFQDGDKVKFLFTKKIKEQDPKCIDEFVERTVVHIEESLYMTKRTITFDDELNEVNTITLDRDLRTRDISDAEYELRTLAQGNGNGGAKSDWVDDISPTGAGTSTAGYGGVKDVPDFIGG